MEIEQLHGYLFDMLCLIDEICVKENIDYYIDSGTLIGAIREKDFIKWDDDADVVMTRRDYVRFRKAAKKYIPSNLRLVEPLDFAPYFFDFIPHLVNLDVPLRDETEEDRAYQNYQNRVSVDFFLLDNAPDSIILQKVQNVKAKFFYGMALSKRFNINSEKYSFIEKIYQKLLSFFGGFFSFQQLVHLYEKNLTRYSKTKTNYYIYESIIKYLLIYPKDYYKETTFVELHGRLFPAPMAYDAVLRASYGDYMIPVKTGYIVHSDIAQIEDYNKSSI